MASRIAGNVCIPFCLLFRARIGPQYFQVSASVRQEVLPFFFSSRRRHTRYIGDWSSDVCSSDLRQLVTHGHITVNGRETKTPSFTVKAGDAIAITEKSRGSNYFKEMTAWAKTQTRPGWLEVDPDAYTAKVLAAPSREQIEAQVNTQLIVEHYSR